MREAINQPHGKWRMKPVSRVTRSSIWPSSAIRSCITCCWALIRRNWAAPFALAVDTSVDLHASELDVHLNPHARFYGLPCIAGHVGAGHRRRYSVRRPASPG